MFCQQFIFIVNEQMAPVLMVCVGGKQVISVNIITDERSKEKRENKGNVE